jgi:hypothetical protein
MMFMIKNEKKRQSIYSVMHANETKFAKDKLYFVLNVFYIE